MNTKCPSCETEYAVTEKDIGRRIACAKCSTHLVVDANGLRETASGLAESRSEKKSSVDPITVRWWESMTALVPVEKVPTLLFGLGVLLVVWFLFMPMIAKDRIDRRNALLQEATYAHNANLRRLRDKNADIQQVTEIEEAWVKKRTELEDDVKRAEFAKGQGAYFDRYGLLLGFLVVAAGAIGWTRANQPLVRRILGAVVLGIELLLAFQTVLPLGCTSAPRAYNSGVVPTPTP